ncbi:MAG: isoleucine--tRNA ligase [Deltaproteobacteria bacterium]|nr:isoleucine--tRNA ligase [Deltaproteobacteria bacterium]
MDYKSTLNLPKTDFPMKASLPQREPEQIRKWDESRAYRRMVEKRRSNPMFVLHDGPPYANGNIHLGHALNKILKDIVIKYKNTSGLHAEFIPGWDCHGLPIELGVEKQLREQKVDKNQLGKVEIRKLCRDFAKGWIDRQRDQFKRLGCFADWDHPYLTMSDEYVAGIVRELGRISKTGNLYKGNKPVYWCAFCATALADAEIEYHDHRSPSIHVKFYFDNESVEKTPELKALSRGKPVALVIWTTTPWTLPANLAIALHPEFDYAALDTGSEILIVAEGLREKFLSETNLSAERTGTIAAVKLERLETLHPFMNRPSLVILGEHVTLDAGTGAVHTAPGHGIEDYKAGLAYGLDAVAPVDAHGKFTADVPEWQGMRVFEANKPIIESLLESGNLVNLSEMQHTYPHCWRCNKPVLFRATPQWFIGMERTNLRNRVLHEIGQVEWIPAWGINRILGMVESRPDWCVSRQRVWGVPITVFYDEKTGDSVSAQESFEHVADLIEKNGPNIWYEWSADRLIKPGLKTDAGHPIDPKHLRKETDILDVWFDSGVSHATVLAAKKNKDKARWPADLYLEGSDQHRGWFQTSLLTAVETREKAPFKRVLTHGFVNDQYGKKMSKSKGNVTDPMEFAEKFGSEILRLWVVVEDYRNDVNFSMETIERVSESYRKVRNTLRYVLGNIFDYRPSMEPGEFCDLDLWALERARLFLERAKQAYEAYEFHLVYHALVNFCAVDLSSVYFDILKDRLYASPRNSRERRSSQAALHRIGTALATALAPILTFTCEEFWGYLGMPGSVLEADFPLAGDAGAFWKTSPEREAAARRVERALELREPVNKALEVARRAKQIGHPLEAAVEITAPAETAAALGAAREELARLFIVSKISIRTGDAVAVKVAAAPGSKCARCWIYTEDVGASAEHPLICKRCIEAVKEAAGA